MKRYLVLTRRFALYVFGMVLLALGITLCAQCNLGTTPISSIPYVLTRCTPFTFGMLTSMSHIVNIVLQYVLERKLWNPRVLLQLPECFLFGALVDLVAYVITYSPTDIVGMVALMCVSIVLIAAGTTIMVGMNLIPNPPDGAVRLISTLVRGDMGIVKRFYDIIMVLGAALIDLIGFHDLYGLGIASLISMYGVGKLISVMQKHFGQALIALREGDKRERTAR